MRTKSSVNGAQKLGEVGAGEEASWRAGETLNKPPRSFAETEENGLQLMGERGAANGLSSTDSLS